MDIATYIRKPLSVEAVQVTEGNMNQIAQWVDGKVHADGPDSTKWFIKVKVIHPLRQKQTQARVGDWVLKSELGLKIYSDKAFNNGFEPAFEDPAVKNPIKSAGNIQTTAEQLVESMTCICGHPEIDNAIHSSTFPCYSNEPVEVPQSLGFQ